MTMTLVKNEFVPNLDISNVSFIVNTKKCGRGKLRCVATYPDDVQAPVEIEKLAKHIYRIRVKAEKTGPLHLFIDHIAAPPKQSKQQLHQQQQQLQQQQQQPPLQTQQQMLHHQQQQVHSVYNHHQYLNHFNHHHLHSQMHQIPALN